MTMFFSLSTSTLLHVVLAASASIPFVEAQTPTPITTDELYAKISSAAAPAPGFNGGGGSVFTNFVNAVNDGQFFYLETGSSVYEKPATEPVQLTFFHWCSDLTFSDLSNSSLIGFAGRVVFKWSWLVMPQRRPQELRGLMLFRKDSLDRLWAYLLCLLSS